MTTEAIVILISIALAASVGSIFFSVFRRKKYKIEVERINAETKHKVAEIVDAEKNNAERIWAILGQQIESSQSKIEHLQKELDALREAGEKTTACINPADAVLTEKSGKQGKAASKKTEKKCYCPHSCASR